MIVIREHRINKVSSTKSSSDESALKLVELSSYIRAVMASWQKRRKVGK